MRIFMQTAPEDQGAPRYYELILQEDLLGGWNVLRQFGRLGARSTVKKDHYADVDSAQSALLQHRDRQLKRGFSVMFVHGGGQR